MHFFGLWGSLFFLIGFIATMWLIIGKIVSPINSPLTNRPGFYIALTCLVIGMQLFLAGFVSELVARNAPGRNSYRIEEKTGL